MPPVTGRSGAEEVPGADVSCSPPELSAGSEVSRGPSIPPVPFPDEAVPVPGPPAVQAPREKSIAKASAIAIAGAGVFAADMIPLRRLFAGFGVFFWLSVCFIRLPPGGRAGLSEPPPGISYYHSDYYKVKKPVCQVPAFSA
jgi:hypothetical protein